MALNTRSAIAAAVEVLAGNSASQEVERLAPNVAGPAVAGLAPNVAGPAAGSITEEQIQPVVEKLIKQWMEHPILQAILILESVRLAEARNLLAQNSGTSAELAFLPPLTQEVLEAGMVFNGDLLEDIRTVARRLGPGVEAGALLQSLVEECDGPLAGVWIMRSSVGAPVSPASPLPSASSDS